MKSIPFLIFLIFPFIISAQNLKIKILETKLIPKKNIKIKLEIVNTSSKTFEFNKIFEIKGTNRNNMNMIAFYDNDSWVNIPNIIYDKISKKKNSFIKIYPNSEKTFTINLKNDLVKERYRGFLLNMNILNFETLKYILELNFKDTKSIEFEKYKVSSTINMTYWKMTYK